MNIQSVLLPNNLTSIILEWDAVQPTCSRDSISYTIDIDGARVPTERISFLSSNSYAVSGLQPNTRYMATVRGVVSNCISDASILGLLIAPSKQLASFPSHSQLFVLSREKVGGPGTRWHVMVEQW